MMHHSRQPMPPTAAWIAVLQAENEALRCRVAELEAELAAERGKVTPLHTPKSQ